MVLADPELTDLGLAQARVIQSRWKEEVENAGMPLPTRRYTSPLTRAMDTCRIQFEDLPGEFKSKVIVYEVRHPFSPCSPLLNCGCRIAEKRMGCIRAINDVRGRLSRAGLGISKWTEA